VIEPLGDFEITQWRDRSIAQSLIMPLTFHKKPALVVYVTCGDPDLATTREIVLAAIEAGADVVEL